MPDYIQDAGFYLRNPQGPRNRVYDEDGDARYERVPATVANSAGIKRYVRVIRETGDVISAVLTNCSSNLDLGSPVAQYYRNKWRVNGWFPLGRCCVSLAINGELSPKALCKENQAAVKSGKGCNSRACSDEESCKHNELERKTRRARHTERGAKRQAAWQSEADKLVDAQRDTQRATAEAMEKMSEALEKITK